MKKNKINMFWTNIPTSDIYSWRYSVNNLLPFHVMSLALHERFSHEVNLYTYQTNIGINLPKNVNVIDAQIYYPIRDAYKSMVELGHSICHISDYVRFKACLENGGIICDLDTIPLREFPKLDNFQASLPAKRTGGVAPQWNKIKPLPVQGWDGKAFGFFPARFTHPIARAKIRYLLEVIKQRLSKPPLKGSRGSNFVMEYQQDIFRDLNKEDYLIFQPILFAPIPYWLGSDKCYSLEHPTRLDGKNKVFGYKLPNYLEILKYSFATSTWFDSSSANKKLNIKNNFWDEVHKDSFIGFVALAYFGNDWRTILKEMSYEKI